MRDYQVSVLLLGPWLAKWAFPPSPCSTQSSSVSVRVPQMKSMSAFGPCYFRFCGVPLGFVWFLQVLLRSSRVCCIPLGVVGFTYPPPLRNPKSFHTRLGVQIRTDRPSWMHAASSDSASCMYMCQEESCGKLC